MGTTRRRAEGRQAGAACRRRCPARSLTCARRSLAREEGVGPMKSWSWGVVLPGRCATSSRSGGESRSRSTWTCRPPRWPTSSSAATKAGQTACANGGRGRVRGLQPVSDRLPGAGLHHHGGGGERVRARELEPARARRRQAPTGEYERREAGARLSRRGMGQHLQEPPRPGKVGSSGTVASCLWNSIGEPSFSPYLVWATYTPRETHEYRTAPAANLRAPRCPSGGGRKSSLVAWG